MNTIKYLLSCIIGSIDAWVGAGSKRSIKDEIAGLASVGAVFVVFSISMFVLLKMVKREKVNITSVAQLVGYSIAITVLVVVLVCTVLIVGEKILQ